MKKTITGIYGGSFNPIHNGHISLARRFLDAAGLDEVWFMVSPQNPLKRHNSLLDDDTRLRMVCAALEDMPGLTACDYEFRLSRPSYTWNTLQAMGSEYACREFVLLIGGDNWQHFDRWYRHDDILRNYRIVIYPRPGSSIDTSSLPENVSVLDTELIDISSTQVRDMIERGEDISHLVPPQTAEMIYREGLYKLRIKG
ncbi:nicotinate-nucleotide adenylyltransferase [Prevotella sp. PCHR]|uniref:Probable nicotinate-nucleotide adenylyltransferase n=1 Tax=Xylanibacter caecicola TaxID=2736294 RepID=A0ABX2B0X5_9BACT|nr:nicotinate (nicotinamide) nucleotide adenylyltransferase [Xylanibacter caecicola]NPE25154.1 nicotinate-nucleotide adenylyltransferase [Xylanibacter caecicola]